MGSGLFLMICAVMDGGLSSQAGTTVILCPFPLLPFPFLGKGQKEDMSLTCLSRTALNGARSSPTSISLSWIPLGYGTWAGGSADARTRLGRSHWCWKLNLLFV